MTTRTAKVLHAGRTRTTGGRDGAARGDSGYFVQARLTVGLPGLDRETVQALARQAHETCPYSEAMRGNIAVETNLA